CIGANCVSENRNLFEDGIDVIISNGFDYPLIKKVKNQNFESLTTITTGRNAFDIIGKVATLNEISKEKPFNGCSKIRCKDNEFRYIEPSLISKNREIFENYKVFISKSAGDPSTDLKIIGSPYIGLPFEACTDSLIPIGNFDNLSEAENLQKYIKTKFLRYLVSILKTSQNVTQIVYQFVPMQDFTENSDIVWSKSIPEIDKQLYKKYQLSAEEIAFIEENVQPME
ncbi:MAG: restriction endonuclease, partial [Bacteroidetes bacterium]|nr:restriction endonuclease [Bacteroidota bacterium]